MKVNLSTPILGLKGDPLLRPDNTPVLLEDVLLAAVLTILPGDEKRSQKEKLLSYDLSLQIAKGGEYDFTDAQIDDLLTRTGLTHGLVILGRVNEIFGKTS